MGIAPGQSAVIYDGSRVVGSCTISSTGRSAQLTTMIGTGTATATAAATSAGSGRR
jgi:hypothetical protein